MTRTFVFGVTVVATIAVLGVVVRGIVQGESPPPPGLVFATPAAATARVLPAAVARKELRATDARIAAVIDAVESGNASGVIGLVHWEDHQCGLGNVYCPGQPGGATAPSVNAGSTIEFFVTADALKPYLAALLGGVPPRLTYAARVKGAAGSYFLAFEADEVKGKGTNPITSDGRPLAGMFMQIDTSTKAPIVWFDFGLNFDVPAERRARDLGLDGQEILVLEDRARIKTVPGTPVILPSVPEP